jgi:hypothetical protein
MIGLFLPLLFDLINPNYTELKIFNPYSSVSLKLEVKCDHNYKTKRYNFHKVFVINRGANMILYTPTNLKKCEIWPLGFKLLGDLK